MTHLLVCMLPTFRINAQVYGIRRDVAVNLCICVMNLTLWRKFEHIFHCVMFLQKPYLDTAYFFVCYMFICFVTMFINFIYSIFPGSLKSSFENGMIKIIWGDLKTVLNKLSTFVSNFSCLIFTALVDKLLWPRSACFCMRFYWNTAHTHYTYVFVLSGLLCGGFYL